MFCFRLGDQIGFCMVEVVHLSRTHCTLDKAVQGKVLATIFFGYGKLSCSVLVMTLLFFHFFSSKKIQIHTCIDTLHCIYNDLSYYLFTISIMNVPILGSESFQKRHFNVSQILHRGFPNNPFVFGLILG